MTLKWLYKKLRLCKVQKFNIFIDSTIFYDILPISLPSATASAKMLDNTSTSLKPKLTPWPANGCTRWAASLPLTIMINLSTQIE